METYVRMDGDKVAEIINLPDGHSIEAMFAPDLVATMIRITGQVPSIGMVRQPDGAFCAAPPPAGTNALIYARLAEIDARSIRPVRAILGAQVMGVPPDAADLAFLAQLKSEADALRSGLAP